MFMCTVGLKEDMDKWLSSIYIYWFVDCRLNCSVGAYAHDRVQHLPRPSYEHRLCNFCHIHNDLYATRLLLHIIDMCAMIRVNTARADRGRRSEKALHFFLDNTFGNVLRIFTRKTAIKVL